MGLQLCPDLVDLVQLVPVHMLMGSIVTITICRYPVSASDRVELVPGMEKVVGRSVMGRLGGGVPQVPPAPACAGGEYLEERRQLPIWGHRRQVVQKYKRLWEMMNNDQKRMATMVNTASGRKFLRGGINEFGSVRQKKDLQQNIYSRFKGLMEGVEGDETVMEEEESYDDLEEGLGQHEFKESEGFEDIHQVEEGDSEVKSVGAVGKDIDKGHKVGENVFGKIDGFPPWLAELLETNPPSCLVLSNYFLNYHVGLWGTWGTPGRWYHSWSCGLVFVSPRRGL